MGKQAFVSNAPRSRVDVEGGRNTLAKSSAQASDLVDRVRCQSSNGFPHVQTHLIRLDMISTDAPLTQPCIEPERVFPSIAQVRQIASSPVLSATKLADRGDPPR
jgi:hypothetical protein